MEFAKYGVVNAGLIFFVLALLSTLVLGRWFCGWGCHLVMLQDLCGWMMRKASIRPKAFRSRLLIYVPLVLALYMFIWPVLYRFAIAPWVRPELEWPGISVHLTTTEFWRSFAGIAISGIESVNATDPPVGKAMEFVRVSGQRHSSWRKNTQPRYCWAGSWEWSNHSTAKGLTRSRRR